MRRLTRRGFVASAAGAAASALPAVRAAGALPSWSAIGDDYTTPDWFRDAKFGIWAHWSAQCVPEFGDWYGRLMYIQGNPFYDHHLKHYGHPADTGFMEIENQWKAEHWNPDHLIDLYKNAGAKYFMALGCHHDNLDTWNSAHHEWNALRVGPKRDIVGGWEKVVRAAGLRFGISNHSSHAWHWWQTAYGYDAIGPRAGERYDAFTLRKNQGAGAWWDGLDPQNLYTGPNMVIPDGVTSIKAMNAWHDAHDGQWMEFTPPMNPAFAVNWLARQKDMVEKYRPDMVYFDDTGLPFGPLGLEALRHYYDQARAWHGGDVDVVLTAKKLTDLQRRAIVEDVERGFSDTLRPLPWQTDTCIGDWHYNRARFINKSYVPAEQVIQRLCDVVAKNGNLLLSIPVRGDGTIDSEEEKIVAGITRWMRRNGDAAIFGSRPWRTFGEGPTHRPQGSMNERDAKPFTAKDVRFTTNGGALYAMILKWPEARLTIASLAKRAGTGRVERVTLLGQGPVEFDHAADGLRVALPRAEGGEMIPVIRIEGRGIV